MNLSIISKVRVFGLFCAICSYEVHADAQFDLTLRGSVDGQPVPEKAQVLVQGGKVRVAFPNAPQYHEIFHDSSTQTFGLVDHGVQDVRYVDAQTVKALTSQAQQIARQIGVEINIGTINDILSGSGNTATKAEVVQTQQYASIANAECEWYTFTIASQQDRGCLINSSQLTFLSTEDQQALTSMMSTARAIGGQVSGLLGDQPALKIVAQLSESQLPLSWQGAADGISFEVRAMESKVLPAGITSIPATYRESPLL